MMPSTIATTTTSTANDDFSHTIKTQDHHSGLGAVDVYDTPDSFLFVCDCPGFTSKDVHVRVTANLLQLMGDLPAQKVPQDSKLLRMERPGGRFSRIFRLPPGADFTNVKANVEQGVLTVTLYKLPEVTKQALLAADMEALSEGDGSLNQEFAKVPLSVFPTPALGRIVMVNSNTSILDAVRMLSEFHVLSAPVIDVKAPPNAGWVEKYLGMLDMTGIVWHMLKVLQPEHPENFDSEIGQIEAFHKTTVKEAITYSGGFGPFIPVDKDRDTLLDCMLLCGQHGLHRVPVVKTPGGDVENIITQSALVQTLAANMSRFQSVGRKTLEELNLGNRGTVISVMEDEPLRKAFELIAENNISAVPVIDSSGRIKGNVSARDVRLIVSSHKIYKLLNMPVSTYLAVVTDDSEHSAITCSTSDTLAQVISTLVMSRIHRVYVVDEEDRPIRVVSLKNVLMKFCKEPEGYFGHFFD